MIGPRTRAILAPNLVGNAPDWDRIREIAGAHGLAVIEDSCDALGATLRGTPTGTRSDISLTSFALSHIITAAGTGGMVLVDDEGLADRCLLLRRWGRRSEIQLFGSRRGDKRFFSDIDGLEYDNLFIFDEVGWNFEPSELSAAFGLVQLRKLPGFLERRRRNFARLLAHVGQYPALFALPRQLADLETGWHMFPILIRPESGIRRAELQQHMEANGVDTRMVWTGNVLRQPAFRTIAHRADPAGYPNADRVMEQGLILPSSHGLDDDDIDYISLHSYYGRPYTERGEYLASAIDMDRFIETVVATCDHVGAERRSTKRIGLSFDEWNVWHRDAEPDHQPWQQAPSMLENRYDLDDAVVVGTLVNSLLRHADRVKVACLAQLVNVIAPIVAEPGHPAWRQSIFWPYRDLIRYGEGDSLRVALSTPEHDVAGLGSVPILDVAATVSVDGDELRLLIANRSPGQSVPTTLDLSAWPDFALVSHEQLVGSTPRPTGAPGWPPPVGVPLPTERSSKVGVSIPALSWNTIVARRRR